MKPRNPLDRSALLAVKRAVSPSGLDPGGPALRQLNDQGQDMCKNGANGNGNGKDQTAETVNVGLINSSSTSFNEIPIWEIVEILSLLILFLLVVRWIRKYIVKRKLKKNNKQARQMAQVAVQMRPAQLDMEIQHPRQIQHRPMASLTELPIEATQQAISNPLTIGAYDQYR